MNRRSLIAALAALPFVGKAAKVEANLANTTTIEPNDATGLRAGQTIRIGDDWAWSTATVDPVSGALFFPDDMPTPSRGNYVVGYTMLGSGIPDHLSRVAVVPVPVWLTSNFFAGGVVEAVRVYWV